MPFVVPEGWPKPTYDFSKNPLTKEGFELGRHLFYDPILSRDNTISCASCHLGLNTPIVLNSNEKTDIIAFLLTLTDNDFLFDKRFGFPRD